MAEEARLQSSILRDLNSHGYESMATKLEKCSGNGWPDILFTSVMHGPGMIEVKSSIGKLSASQKETIPRLNKAGMKTYVISSWEQWIELRKVIVTINM